MRGPPFVVAAGVAALGALQTFAFVHGGLWPLQLAATAVLAALVLRSTPGRAAILGFAFSCAWLCAGTWWLFVSMHRYGGLAAPLAALAVLALASFLSLYLAVAMAAVARIVARRDPGPAASALVFAAGWLLSELARGVFFTGFPWVAGGYAHVDSPLAGFAPWVGVYGIGAIAAFVAAWIAAAVVARRRQPATAGFPAASSAHIVRVAVGVVAVFAAGALLATLSFTAPTGRLTVSLLQGNVPQHEKFQPRLIPEALAATARQLDAARGRLVVGPETVIPLLPRDLDPVWWQGVTARFAGGDRAALLGAPMGDERVGFTNSALGIASANEPYRYDKHHLVPFGEFVPWGFRWFTELMNIPLGDFDRGPLVAPSFAFAGERIAPNICYEDLFGEELAARFVDAGAAPTILANLSNIGWFGRTIAVEQHLRISRLRALELERPMLRATNTGATAAIDHRGRVTGSLEPFTAGVLEADVEGRRGTTPYAAWAGRVGLLPLWALALAVLIAFERKAQP